MRVLRLLISRLIFIVIARHEAIWFTPSPFSDEIASFLAMTGIVFSRSQIPFGNALACEVPLRNHGRVRICTGWTNGKREIEFQERLRSQMEFGNERCNERIWERENSYYRLTTGTDTLFHFFERSFPSSGVSASFSGSLSSRMRAYPMVVASRAPSNSRASAGGDPPRIVAVK